MFIIELTYKKPLSAVEQYLEEHRAFLDAGYAAGAFLMSGPKEPREGGVIVALGDNPDEVQHLIERDPFHREEIADYRVIRFRPNKAAPAAAGLVLES